MEIEINRTSDNPANTMLEVYAHNTRPFCKIYEEDFIELLSDNQIKKLENGETKFNVNKQHLIARCKQMLSYP